MSTLSSSFACREHRTPKPSPVADESDRDLVAWARDVIRNPQRYGADQHVSDLVADLLIRFEATR